MKKYLLILFFGLTLAGVASAQSIFTGKQGGTGFGTTAAGNIGNCLSVSSVTPLTYTFGSCAGSGNSAFTIGPSLIYNATSTDLVGIGTITPTTTLFVQGKAGTNILSVVSSTGTSLLIVTNAGKVGINNTTPQAKLDIRESGAIVSLIRLINTLGNTGGGTSITFGANFIGGDPPGNDVSSFGSITMNNSGAAYTSDFVFRTSNVNVFNIEKMRLTGEGRLGIGSSTPTAMLVVQGTTTTSNLPLFVLASSTGVSQLRVENNGSTTLSSLGTGCVGAVSGSLYIAASNCTSSAGNSAWTIGSGLIYNATSTDEIGIGTATPATTLHIQGNGAISPFRISTSTGATMLTVSPLGQLGVQPPTNTTSAFSLKNSAGTEIVTMSTVDPGNGITFEIASTSGSSLLAVYGNGSTTIGQLGTGCVNSVSGALYVATCAAGGSGGGVATTTPFLNGFLPFATGSAPSLANSPFLTNGLVSGINATSSTVTFNLQGKAGSSDILNVTSSTGISVLMVTNNQRVGIGSTTPHSTFVVQGTSTSPTLTVFTVASNTGASLFSVTPTSITSSVSMVLNNNLAYQVKNAVGTAINVATIDGSSILNYGGAGVNTINMGSTDARFSLDNNGLFAAITTNGTERLRVLSTGLVGIGTTAPISLLSLQGTSGSTAALFTISSSTGATILSVVSGIPASGGELGRNTTQGALNYYDNGQLGTISKTIAAGVGTQTLTNSTTTAQDFTTIYTFPANTIFTNKVYRLNVVVESVTGVSSVTSLQYLKLGSATVYTSPTTDIGNSATRSTIVSFIISGRDAASASSSVTTSNGGIGPESNAASGNNTNQPVTAIPTNGTLNLILGNTWSGTGSTDTKELQSWFLEEIN